METSLSRTALLASQVSSEGRDYQEIFCATCGFLRSDDVFEARYRDWTIGIRDDDVVLYQVVKAIGSVGLESDIDGACAGSQCDCDHGREPVGGDAARDIDPDGRAAGNPEAGLEFAEGSGEPLQIVWFRRGSQVDVAGRRDGYVV